MRGASMVPEAGRPSIASVRYTPMSSFLDAVAPLLVAGAVAELLGPEGGGVERDLDRLDGAVRESEGPANPHLVSSGSQGSRGARDAPRTHRAAQAVWLADDGRVLGQHARRHLLPGGEAVCGGARGGAERAGARGAGGQLTERLRQRPRVLRRKAQPRLAVTELVWKGGEVAHHERRPREHRFEADERMALEARGDGDDGGSTQQVRHRGPVDVSEEVDARRKAARGGARLEGGTLRAVAGQDEIEVPPRHREGIDQEIEPP